MTIYDEEIQDYFKGTVVRDFFKFMVGDYIGSGQSRIVYQHLHREDLVLKFEPDAQSFNNVAEWSFWSANKHSKRVASWLAPCEFISPCGVVLAMKKTTPVVNLNYPRKVPEFLSDLKCLNFGMLDGRLVAHDYAMHNVTTPTEFKGVKWKS